MFLCFFGCCFCCCGFLVFGFLKPSPRRKPKHKADIFKTAPEIITSVLNFQLALCNIIKKTNNQE